MKGSTTKAFAICHNGSYLRKIAWGGYFEWVGVISDARLYSSEESLNKHLLKVARTCPDKGPWPVVHEFDLVLVNKVDNSARFLKNRERAEKAEATRRANGEKYRQQEAQREVDRLEDQLRYAKQRAAVSQKT